MNCQKMDAAFEVGGAGVPADPKLKVVSTSDRGFRGMSRTLLQRHKTTTRESDPFSFDGVKIANGPLGLLGGRGGTWRQNGRRRVLMRRRHGEAGTQGRQHDNGLYPCPESRGKRCAKPSGRVDGWQSMAGVTGIH